MYISRIKKARHSDMQTNTLHSTERMPFVNGLWKKQFLIMAKESLQPHRIYCKLLYTDSICRKVKQTGKKEHEVTYTSASFF